MQSFQSHFLPLKEMQLTVNMKAGKEAWSHTHAIIGLSFN